MDILLQRKTSILNCAGEIIQKYGLANLMMDEVATHCGISKKTIYQIFPSKDNLIQELTAAFLRDELAIWETEIQKLFSPVEKVHYFIQFLFRSIELLPYENISLLKKRHHASYLLLTDFYEQLSNDFTMHVEEGQVQGLFHSSIDAHILRQHIVQQFLTLQEKYRELTISNAYSLWKEQLKLYFDHILFYKGNK